MATISDDYCHPILTILMNICIIIHPVCLFLFTSDPQDLSFC